MMQTPVNFSHPRLSFSLKGLLFSTLLTTGLPSLAACIDYDSQVQQAVQTHDFDTLEQLLPTLKKQDDCLMSYLDGVKRSMAQIVAAQADHLVQQGRFKAALALLKRAPTMIWETQVVHGDIAAHRRQWQTAAHFFNQSLDLIADPQATPQVPPKTVIEQVYQLAYELQLLVGGFDTVVKDSGEASGMMRSNVRGIVPIKRLLPVQFAFGGTRLNSKGKKSAQKLAAYLERKGVVQVTLIGHTDAKGSRAINQKISNKRANSVKKYLRKSGITATIDTFGKGEDEPLKLANRWKLTPAEIDALNRRVEFTYRR